MARVIWVLPGADQADPLTAELLVVIAIIALLIGILVPALGAARRAANKMKNGTQLTAIGKSLVLWSDQFYQATNDFPKMGLSPIPPVYAGSSAATGLGTNKPELRLGALVNTGSDPLGTQMLINPVGVDQPQTTLTAPNITLTGAVGTTVGNLSYALEEAKCAEWKNKTNASCPMSGDKQVTATSSFWNTKYWEGSVGWGDTHVSYESGQSATTWPTTTVNGSTTPNDPLFTGGEASNSPATDVCLINPNTNL